MSRILVTHESRSRHKRERSSFFMTILLTSTTFNLAFITKHF